MTDSVCMIFFRSTDHPRLNLEAAGQLLEEAGLDVSTDADALDVCWDDGPTLRITFSAAPHVMQEAVEIAEGTQHLAGMRLCDARFEIGMEDLSEVLDEINTLIEVQSTLQGATGGYLFNAWNGELTGSDGAA